MVIFFTYLLLIKDASAYKDIHHHNHHVTGKETLIVKTLPL